ncbi:c2bcfbd8-c15f-44c9-aeba-1e4d0f9bb4fc [Sclerotinia trifoliorum]|uniref:C2bcfbd8-c15f-44c9-aeba-1e4d0f9bb4fc n=1 Tax=Sclerotinia trifoliorum TaxID=28548 RepID=A0A8H2VLA3_9HELO|nr:c2bcfbd8-c15f-44c9-aeba-1e4d0f9bb4fc [Sclerotinia trifoliorum]
MPFVTINGKSIFYTITPQTGNLSNPITILFIHGLGSSSSFYHTIIPELSRLSTCIAFDTPGSGLSSLGGLPQTVESITNDAVALIDSLSGTAVNEKVWVVGHSMGGMIACELAIRYPRAVKGLILLGPIDPSPALSEIFTKRIATVETDGLEPLADSIPKAATGSKASHSQRAFIRSLILGTSSAGYLSLCQVIALAKKPDYAKIQVPLMILAGSEDKTASYEGCVKIHDNFGVSAEKKCIQVLPAVGHWHAIEAPEAVVREIIDFFDKKDDMERDERS